MKLLLVLPLVFSIVAFILSLLSLLAGYKPGFMEDYNLMTFNTSALGQSVIQDLLNGGSIAGVTIPSGAAGVLGSLGSEVADQLADQLGIGEFYSVHAMDLCQGQFEPSATTPGASHNATACSKPLDFSAYNVTAKLDSDLSLGPFRFSLTQLGVSESVQQKLNDIPQLAKALAAVFIVSVILTGLTMLSSALAFVLSGGRMLSFFNLLLAALAAIFLLASSLIATIGPPLVAQQIRNNAGDTIGLEVVSNRKLYSLTWAAFALMLVSTFFFFSELIVECVRRRRAGRFGEKSSSYPMYGK